MPRVSKKKAEEQVTPEVTEEIVETEEIIDGSRYMTGFTKEYIRVYRKTEEDLSNSVLPVILDRFVSKDMIVVK